MPKKQINTTKWQDYRGKTEGILIYLESSPSSELPVRDVLNETGKGFKSEPDYSTNTYGFFGCSNTKLNSSVIKSKRRYFFFGTQYAGTLEAFKNKFLITGYMRIDKILDVRKRHSHAWMETKGETEAPDCVNLRECWSFYSEDMNFYKPEDCFELTEDVMKGWGYKGRIAKHMKLSFTEDHAQEILDHFSQQTPQNEAYIAKVESLLAEKAKLLAESEESNEEEDDSDW